MEEKTNDLTETIAQALNEMKSELGDNFDLDKISLAELGRRTNISRAKLRRIKEDGFVDKPHKLTGRKAEVTVLTGYTGIIDNYLRQGITNSSLCLTRLRELGLCGSGNREW